MDSPRLTWRKSAYSGQTGNCVEVASLPGGGRAVRDSKVPEGAVLVCAPREWRAFLQGLKGDGLSR
ncbi:DUF397 domain-containing protein [Sphaerisporangium dianthi]|uniref:DUF397 domain-containing protein n=1 Tax=Sphaerisporangium dianthi TaxID=1436120 RepID=A0ABV9CN74_9ACTN